MATVEGCRRLGIDVWSHPAMRRMCTLPVRYTMSNGSLPRFGDDVNSSARVPGVMEPAYAAYKDPGIAGLLPKGPTWDSILLGRPAGDAPPLELAGSEVFPGAGHAILRSQGEARLSAAITFGPYGGFHGHFDKLSFVFFGHDKELGIDPGRAASQAYCLPIHTRWYKATLSHNTVLVDGPAQRPATGKLELFATTATHSAVLASCDAAYPGVSHRRLLCIAPNYLLVFDELTAKEPRRFDWLYHHRSTSISSADAQRNGDLPADYAGSEFLKSIKQGSTDGPVQIDFASPDLTTRLTLAASPATEIRTADGPGASILDRVPLAMVTRRGSSAHFAAVLEPHPIGVKPAVTSISLAIGARTTRILVENAETRETITLTPEGTLIWMRNDDIVLKGTGRP